jgi:formamidopyrimidine-DNA glycosylase
LSVSAIGGRFIKRPVDFSNINFPLKNTIFNCKGKFIFWTFNDDVCFFLTLGMTGSFGQREKHSALEFEFRNGKIYFNDPRHFGTFKIVKSKDFLIQKLNQLGWDPFYDPTGPEQIIINKIRKYNEERIIDILLKQDIFCGVGNYIRSEVLYLSKIHPETKVKNLTDQNLFVMFENVKNVVFSSFQNGGATLKDYKDTNGKSGSFASRFKVYGRKFDDANNLVKKIPDKNGRMVHFVQEIQK